jgi:lipopolysaccharide assembly outer membrane protein LptD (OstA)
MLLAVIRISAQEKVDSVASEKTPIDARVEYTSKDSMVMTGDGLAFMYGDGELRYKSMELTAEYIRICMDSSTLFARGEMDTIENEVVGKPVFKDGKDSYESNEITYNLKTQKGIIRHVVTEQSEGYVIADKTKKTEGDVLMMQGGKPRDRLLS